MKLFVIALTLCSALAVVRAAPTSSDEVKRDKALKECNATIPVLRNPRDVLGNSVAFGDIEFTKLSKDETCFLHCYLQKVEFLDENADIKNGKDLLNYTLTQIPQLAKYSDVVIAQIFQLSRFAKVFEDKCFKAFAIFHQFATNLFTLAIADGLEESTGVKDKITNSIQTGQPVEKELENNVKLVLGFFESMFSAPKSQSQARSMVGLM